MLKKTWLLSLEALLLLLKGWHPPLVSPAPHLLPGLLGLLMRCSTAGPTSSTSNLWVVNADNTQDTAILKLSEKPGPSSWLKEFVLVGFQGGKLAKRLEYTHCPDPFCGLNGPAPENCIAAWCTVKTAGG
ncbi:hypothetical protein DEU56DRAFT_911322 [Suillus clintonianus]|uniref:uncharacterized protein n=1 Tax=Suillus clintonianus TaxID=1904413 RepID=UPI001B875398|nr:uncharacterized protein DEU56DRAFT_911322 [Suillus clintonianus]KAG2141214.1 hypothetical protein DEU56DRAFT_911322 [Suillus clintonianus]